MSIWNCLKSALAAALIGAGCGSSDRPDSKISSATVPVAPKTNAPAGLPQAKLQTLKLWVGPEELVAELAITENQIMTGMMHRVSMAENEGMLFVFGNPHRASFWMKNTVLPLSCAYIDPDGIILETHDMKPLDEAPIQAATNRVQYVLEVNQGWFQRHNVKPGALIRTERGSLAETFMSRR